MPYKDREVARKKAAERYQAKKHLWKDEHGNWKKQSREARDARNARQRKRWAEDAEYRKNHLEKARKLKQSRAIFGKCPICEEDNVKLVRDHDHATGGWRGMLCSRCNLAIGHGRDSSRLLSNAAAYLKKYGR